MMRKKMLILSEEQNDAEDIKDLRRILAEKEKCYQRAKETQSDMDWAIWNDMLEVWYSRCADGGGGMLRTIDALTAVLDAAHEEIEKLREACSKMLVIANKMEEEFSNLDHDSYMDSRYVNDIRHEMFAVGVGDRKDIVAALESVEKTIEARRAWTSKTHYWDGVPIPPEQIERIRSEILNHETYAAKLRTALEGKSKWITNTN